MLPSFVPNAHAVAIVAALIKQYFYIAFLMARPQELPAGRTQMQIGIGLNFVTYVLALVSFTGVGRAAMHAAIDLACTAGLMFVALMVVRKQPRFEQAYGGLCGASAILNTAAIPLLMTSVAAVGASPGLFAQFCQFLLLVWSLSLGAHILRHTFDIRLSTSVFIAFMYYLLITSVLSALIPPEAVIDQMS